MSKPTVANFLHALLAVLLGNAIYFLTMRHLPSWAQHTTFGMDTGMLVDFLICLVIFLGVKSMAGRKREFPTTNSHS